MGHRTALIALATVMVSAVLGCGGSRGTTPNGGHTYVFVPVTQSLLPPKGVYLTIISPAALPASVLRNGGVKRVAQAKGPQGCSYRKPIQGLPGKAAYLNGRTVTVKVNGSNPFTTSLCSAIKKDRTFHPTPTGGE
jgi:hypothetical protein